MKKYSLPVLLFVATCLHATDIVPNPNSPGNLGQTNNPFPVVYATQIAGGATNQVAAIANASVASQPLPGAHLTGDLTNNTTGSAGSVVGSQSTLIATALQPSATNGLVTLAQLVATNTANLITTTQLVVAATNGGNIVFTNNPIWTNLAANGFNYVASSNGTATFLDVQGGLIVGIKTNNANGNALEVNGNVDSTSVSTLNASLGMASVGQMVAGDAVSSGNMDAQTYTINGSPLNLTNYASKVTRLFCTNCAGSYSNYNGIYNKSGSVFTNSVTGWAVVPAGGYTNAGPYTNLYPSIAKYCFLVTNYTGNFTNDIVNPTIRTNFFSKYGNIYGNWTFQVGFGNIATNMPLVSVYAASNTQYLLAGPGGNLDGSLLTNLPASGGGVTNGQSNVWFSGNFGIGNNNPQYPLDVSQIGNSLSGLNHYSSISLGSSYPTSDGSSSINGGGISLSAGSGEDGSDDYHPSGGTVSMAGGSVDGEGAGAAIIVTGANGGYGGDISINSGGGVYGSESDGFVSIATPGLSATLTDTGIGINNSSPATALDVNGTIGNSIENSFFIAGFNSYGYTDGYIGFDANGQLTLQAGGGPGAGDQNLNLDSNANILLNCVNVVITKPAPSPYPLFVVGGDINTSGLFLQNGGVYGVTNLLSTTNVSPYLSNGIGYIPTNLPASYSTASNPTNSYTTGVLYTNTAASRALLIGSAVLTSAVGGSANVTIYYTNSGSGYLLPIQEGTGVAMTNDIIPFTVPLNQGATFKLVTTTGSGASATVTNVVLWR